MPSRSLASAIAVFAVLVATIAGGVLALRQFRPSAAPAEPGHRPSARTSRPRSPESRASASRPAGPASRADPFGAAGTALASDHPGMILAAVYDLSTGQEWRLGQGRSQAEASVVKLDILETLLARYRTARLTLPPGDLPAAQRMMEFSDNDAATALWFAAGGPGDIASYNTAVGLRRTSLSQCVDCPGFAWPGWGLSTTTPEDQITLLGQLISPRSLLTAGERRYALGLMENVTPEQRWGVSGGVPSGATVALKDGWLPLDPAADDWQVNSVGWVSGDGRDYLMAVLTTGNPTEQDGIDVIDDLSGIVWRALK